MKTRSEILAGLYSLLPDLRQRYPIGEVRLFGSYARGDQTPESDVDLAVEFTGSIGFRPYMALIEELSNGLGVRVDLVDLDGMKPLIRERVDREGVPL